MLAFLIYFRDFGFIRSKFVSNILSKYNPLFHPFNLNDTIAMLKLQKNLEKNSDSDGTDSLDGWDLDKK